jgi:hypothetical protein
MLVWWRPHSASSIGGGLGVDYLSGETGGVHVDNAVEEKELTDVNISFC